MLHRVQNVLNVVPERLKIIPPKIGEEAWKTVLPYPAAAPGKQSDDVDQWL